MVLLAGVTACDALDSLLAVELPGEILAEDVEDPTYAGLLVEGVVADFECALSPTVLWGALLGDELTSDGDDGGGELERRDVNPESGYWTFRSCDVGTGFRGNWIPLSVSRWSADNTLELLEGWTDTEVAERDSLIAVAAAYSGYAHVLLAENFCSVSLDVGPEMTPAEVLERAVSRFDRAITAAETSGSATTLQLAHLGRARARLNLGRVSEAASDAARGSSSRPCTARRRRGPGTASPRSRLVACTAT